MFFSSLACIKEASGTCSATRSYSHVRIGHFGEFCPTKARGGDQIEVFKILNGNENIDSNIFFEIKK